MIGHAERLQQGLRDALRIATVTAGPHPTSVPTQQGLRDALRIATAKGSRVISADLEQQGLRDALRIATRQRDRGPRRRFVTARASRYVDTAHYLLACEKKRPYRCQVIEIPVAWLDIGWAWCERQIARLARHYESGSWPRVDCEMVTLPQPPAWAENDVGDEDAA